MPASLDRMQEDPLFLESDCPMAVLDTALVVRAVNEALETSVHRRADQLLGGDLFQMFPPNPEVGEEEPELVRRSLGRVLATRTAQHLVFLRYDVLDPRRPGRYLEKYWVPFYAPIFEQRELVGIQICAQDVTGADARIRHGLAAQRELLGRSLSPTTSHEHCARAGPVAAGGTVDDDCERLAAEAEHLRRALESRATIEQAKGIVMADRGCGPQDAFQALVGLSQASNRKLRDVAAELVAESGSRGPGVAV